MKNCLKVVFVIIGTLIGAGFASGQEVYLFFYSYGIKGIIGILISSILMGIIIYKTLILVKENDINNYKDLLYYYSKDGSYESFANDTSQIVSKTTYKTTTTLLQDNKFELNICLETFLDTLSVQSYLILEDNSNNFYFYQKSFDNDFINTPVVFDNLSNPNSNIHKITLSLSYDLTTRDEY